MTTDITFMANEKNRILKDRLNLSAVEIAIVEGETNE